MKNIRFLKSFTQNDLSTDIEALFKRSEELFNNRLMLNRLVEWHNFIKTNLHPIELKLINNELNDFYELLSRTLLALKWGNSGNFWSFLVATFQ